MSALRLRRVGNRKVWVDPADVVAVQLRRSSSYQIVLTLQSGAELVVHADVTYLGQSDVDAVVLELDRHHFIPNGAS